MDLPETTLWWSTTPHQQQQNTSEPPLQQHYHQPTTWFNSHGDPPLHYHNNNFNLNNQNDNDQEVDEEEVENDNNDDENNDNSATTTTHLEDEKEPMFEKPLTPSDVGKLNRLVIPKQHAEKYFPLGGHGVSNECKGLLLSFEDESGKCWRFRYSYWNSSQSYVLTKGWSRYVKDKRLDAGDVVLFERHRVESQRLFINWRRRRTSGTEAAHVSRDVNYGSKNEVGGGVGGGWTRGFYPAHPYPAHHQLFPYQQGLHAGRSLYLFNLIHNNSSS